MKKIIRITTTIAIMALLHGCTSQTSEPQGTTTNIKQYNICLVLDGTDRLSEQNGVPQVTVEEIKELSDMLSTKGVGTLYVSYVDNNCDNNNVVIFEWGKTRPDDIGRKPDYMMMSEYKNQKEDCKAKQDEYDDCRDSTVTAFSKECIPILEAAYSDFVAKQKNGSDVNGAINQAIRMLQASEDGSSTSYIILVSDGCDNVGKELQPIPDNTELIVVNTNVTKHQYGDLVSREFVNLQQAVKYIFK